MGPHLLSQPLSLSILDAISEEEAKELEEREATFNNARPSILSIVEGVINYKEISEFERSGNRHRDRRCALGEVDELSDSNFAITFRMSREGFDKLLCLISPILDDTDETMATLSSFNAPSISVRGSSAH